MGIEPTTPCLQSRCSSQLSYVPAFWGTRVRALSRYPVDPMRGPTPAVEWCRLDHEFARRSDPRMDEPTYIEVRSLDTPNEPPRDRKGPARPMVALAVVAALAVVVGTVVFLVGDDGGRAERTALSEAARDTTVPGPPPGPIGLAETARRAADCYELAPTEQNLRALFEATGGFDALEVGTATGAFDVVTFDPLDHDQLLAARRTGYLADGNEEINQRWDISAGSATQALWDPTNPHDFMHYNTDGTITVWVHDGDGDGGYVIRRAIVLDQASTRTQVMSSSSTIQADRFAVDGRTVFALTSNPDWYAPRDAGYTALVADDGIERVRLASGASFGWIDVPSPGLLVAYPTDASGVTAVWDTQTLDRLDDHPLSDRPYLRVAVARDVPIALGVTHDGLLEPLDLATGRTGARFGRVDSTELDKPVALSDDGTVAVTVDKSGTVSIWFVGSSTPIATYEASTALPRWLPTSRSAARVASVVAPDASRVALRIPARPQVSVSWRVIDTDVHSWIARARTAVGDSVDRPSRSAADLSC
jgi:hypothetical protein